jgi:hypothetical protein
MHLSEEAHRNIRQLDTGLCLRIRKPKILNRLALAGQGRAYDALPNCLLHIQDMAGILKHRDAAHVKDTELIDQEIGWIYPSGHRLDPH